MLARMGPMSASAKLRLRLASTLLASVGAASLAGACSGEVSSTQGSGGGGPGTGGSTPTTTTGNSCFPAAGGDATVVCFVWPTPTTASSGGGGGGAGGAGPTGGTGGAGGAQPCPSPADADAAGLLGYGSGCGFAAVQPGTFKGGQCCYPATTSCCSGRPLIVDGQIRTAAVRSTAPRASGWRGGEAPAVESLAPELRAALAGAWLRDALLEHASIASFSKFAIELLTVGAPSELLDAAHAAARDEVRHARACFALASAYAGRELAPGPLALGGALELGTDLSAIAASAVKEGCVGETLAAVQAAEQLDAATDPAVRAALEMIVDDEARHAELAWRFVAWAVRTGGEPVRRAVERAFAEAVAGQPTVASLDDHPILRAHGRVSGQALRAAFELTIAETIRPAARRLTGERAEQASGAWA